MFRRPGCVAQRRPAGTCRPLLHAQRRGPPPPASVGKPGCCSGTAPTRRGRSPAPRRIDSAAAAAARPRRRGRAQEPIDDAGWDRKVEAAQRLVAAAALAQAANLDHQIVLQGAPFCHAGIGRQRSRDHLAKQDGAGSKAGWPRSAGAIGPVLTREEAGVSRPSCCPASTTQANRHSGTLRTPRAQAAPDEHLQSMAKVVGATFEPCGTAKGVRMALGRARSR